MTNLLKCGLIGSNISRTRMPMALDVMCRAEEMELDFSLIDTEHDNAFDFRTVHSAPPNAAATRRRVVAVRLVDGGRAVGAARAHETSPPPDAVGVAVVPGGPLPHGPDGFPVVWPAAVS